ncbi:ATP-binding protein [Acaryochloris sp. IP29b_bin.148]|uniref:ATP-binding protein n=1 Tax=Acaryochloris sp. IP29b_bin.148 TaxID=2969218 RepID=UPI00260255E3|nr:ATP-binding protein [Acaryochloris sp. IP29b_bin.148]
MAERLCHFLIGPPGAGKSTFAQILTQLHPHSVWICPDHIRKQLYGDASIQGTWAEIEAIIHQQFDQAIQAQHPVIYDATNAKAQWRLDFLQRYRPPGIQWLGWQLTTSVQTCIHRNQFRSHQVPPDVILTYAQYLNAQPPSIAEGFLQVLAVPFDRQDQVNINKTQQLITAAQQLR